MAARAGNEPSTRVLAKQLVRLREHMVRLQTAAAGLQGVKASLSVSIVFDGDMSAEICRWLTVM